MSNTKLAGWVLFLVIAIGGSVWIIQDANRKADEEVAKSEAIIKASSELHYAPVGDIGVAASTSTATSTQ